MACGRFPLLFALLIGFICATSARSHNQEVQHPSRADSSGDQEDSESNDRDGEEEGEFNTLTTTSTTTKKPKKIRTTSSWKRVKANENSRSDGVALGKNRSDNPDDSRTKKKGSKSTTELPKGDSRFFDWFHGFNAHAEFSHDTSSSTKTDGSDDSGGKTSISGGGESGGDGGKGEDGKGSDSEKLVHSTSNSARPTHSDPRPMPAPISEGPNPPDENTKAPHSVGHPTNSWPTLPPMKTTPKSSLPSVLSNSHSPMDPTEAQLHLPTTPGSHLPVPTAHLAPEHSTDHNPTRQNPPVASSQRPLAYLKSEIMALVVTNGFATQLRRLTPEEMVKLANNSLTDGQKKTLSEGKAAWVATANSHEFPAGHYFFKRPFRAVALLA